MLSGEADVWAVGAGGHNPLNLTAGNGRLDAEPAWSPDGRQIAFVSNRGGWHQAWAAPFDGGHRTGEPRRLTAEEGDVDSLSWSGDGHSLGYVLATDAGSEVRVAPADGSARTHALTSGARAAKVRWCQALGGWVVSGLWGESQPGIRLVPASGGTATRLPVQFEVVLDAEYPHFDISPDGALLTVLQRTRKEEIWFLEADEGAF